MQSKMLLPLVLLALQSAFVLGDIDDQHKKHHHHHHHHKHKKVANTSAASQTAKANSSGVPAKVTAAAPVVKAQIATSSAIVSKMRQLEHDLSSNAPAKSNEVVEKGTLEVNGPVPADFAERFQQVVGFSTNSDPNQVKVTNMKSVDGSPGVVELSFEAPRGVVNSVENQAADPKSQLANSPLHDFLVERDPSSMPDDNAPEMAVERAVGPVTMHDSTYSSVYGSSGASSSLSARKMNAVKDSGIDVDTEMPYGELEPFGREDTAQELTEQSIKQSDEMVDQLERAEVSEEKRAVFRALTRLRGAAITSFDGVARSQTGNIDEYNKIHKWRMTHPLHHLADEESDISKWAFPDNAD